MSCSDCMAGRLLSTEAGAIGVCLRCCSRVPPCAAPAADHSLDRIRMCGQLTDRREGGWHSECTLHSLPVPAQIRLTVAGQRRWASMQMIKLMLTSHSLVFEFTQSPQASSLLSLSTSQPLHCFARSNSAPALHLNTPRSHGRLRCDASRT